MLYAHTDMYKDVIHFIHMDLNFKKKNRKREIDKDVFAGFMHMFTHKQM